MTKDVVLHAKYRPSQFDQIIGHDALVESFERILEKGGSHAFLLSGPAGVGKTSLARIAARKLDSEIIEIDAASCSGVNDMRGLKALFANKPFSKPHRSIIVDECASLTSPAWQTLLKITEEPPPHLFWFFCTTDADKVPGTIQNRCTRFDLSPVSDEDLHFLLAKVCKAEKIALSSSIGDLIVVEAQGSPRQLLVNLELCRGVSDLATAAVLLRMPPTASGPVLDLCRCILKGRTWQHAMTIVNRLERKVSPEAMRIAISIYLANALRNAPTEREAIFIAKKLEAFSAPYAAAEQIAPLILSLAHCLLKDSAL